MTTPALPEKMQTPASAKLPWWTYVKDSYGELKHLPMIVRGGFFAILIQFVIMFVVTHNTLSLADAAFQLQGRVSEDVPLSPEQVAQAIAMVKSLGTVIFTSLIGGVLLLSFRAALYRWQLFGAPLQNINPLKIGREEWTLFWYPVKIIWYSSWPLFLLTLAGLVVMLGMAAMHLQSVGFLIMMAASIVLAFLVLSLVCLIWVQKRMSVLAIASPGIFDTPKLFMWKDVWPRTKLFRWGIFFGTLCIPLEFFMWFTSQFTGHEEGITWIMNLYRTFPVQVYIAAFLLFILWYMMMIAKIAFEVRCYRFLKNTTSS